MKVIKVNSYRQKGEVYYLNIDNINAVYRKTGEDYTTIYLGEPGGFTASETPEQIFRIIAEVSDKEKMLIHEGIHSNKIGITVIEKPL